MKEADSENGLKQWTEKFEKAREEARTMKEANNEDGLEKWIEEFNKANEEAMNNRKRKNRAKFMEEFKQQLDEPLRKKFEKAQQYKNNHTSE